MIAQYKVTRLNLMPDRFINFIMMLGRIIDFKNLAFLDLRIGLRNGREQGAGVRMEGMGEQGFGLSKFDQKTFVNHSNPIADKAHYGKIMGNEQIG